MESRKTDILKSSWIILSEAAASFTRNNGLTAASSLAFSAMLALIPALFLLTVLLGAAIGSSARAVQQTRELMSQVIPAYSQVIIREVSFIAAHKGTIGLVNLLVLFWSITPLAADLRVSLGTIFRRKPPRAFLLEKLFDVGVSVVFLVGLTAVSVAGIVLSLVERIQPLQVLPGYLKETGFFTVVWGIVFALYFIFSRRARFRHLLMGSLVTALLWFALRPAFHLFLTFNPGYGYAFGSFKSLFVVIIWIYFSLALFLYGAEVVACLGRDETVYLKGLMEGRKNIPAGVLNRSLMRCKKGSSIYREGDPAQEMYFIRAGKVSIRKGDREVAVVPQGESFGGLSFLLSSPRTVSAVALEDAELVVLNNENIKNLMNQFPELVVAMMRAMALRIREMNRIND